MFYGVAEFDSGRWERPLTTGNSPGTPSCFLVDHVRLGASQPHKIDDSASSEED